jgi:hypothetical protein
LDTDHAAERLAQFIWQAGDVFECEDFSAEDIELDVDYVEDEVHPFYCADVLRTDTNEIHRFCVMESPLPLDDLIPHYFGHYRALEVDADEKYGGAILLFKGDDMDEDFWYLQRNEAGEIGLFHSDLSLDDEEEEE